MTSSEAAEAGRSRIGGAGWRAEAQRAQQEALPSGSILVTCGAPFGGGGLGRHLQEITEASKRRGQPTAHICDSTDPLAATSRRGVHRLRALGAGAPLFRYSPALRQLRISARFDLETARRLPAADHLIGFNGTSLAQFRRARLEGGPTLGLVSATTHMRRVVSQHRLAHRRYPIERPWSPRVLGRNLKEYELADRIYVSSRHSWESFAAEGFSGEVLSLFPLTPDPRFRPQPPLIDASTFDIVYAGSLTVEKGVPLLLDAFMATPGEDLRLHLMGGWRSRGMRRFIAEARTRDPRIEVGPGDPLERLRSARLYVHPSFSDGFGYAAAEALACGVPALVSEDTGMKELIDPGVTGLVLATGDLAALTEAIGAAYRGEILS
jgi:glycosyltransferase involved in cell wall biosynthesis